MNHINNILKRNYFYLRLFKLSRWHILVLLLIFFSVSLSAYSENGKTVENNSYISVEKEEGVFTLSISGKSAPLCVNSQDYPGVIRVLKHLQTDIGRVTNVLPALSIDTIPAAKEIVLVGTLGKSPLIDKLVQDKKLDVEDISGCWETFLIQIVEKPLPNVDRALIIAGSDKRGTIYGIYDLSEKIGVSPWYWWADVPVKKKSNVYVLPGRYTHGEPKVKYRGIFINDEAPALSGWAYEKYGGFNSKFYEHVFELILRLKGNFLWPAMWGRAFYDDDPMNPKLADEYGIVIGTSHHEPMMRAHDEWRRFGSGQWNYATNRAKLREFWKEGIRRMGDYESIITLAMRGDGDEPMSEEANISLLEKIVKEQREILGEVTGKKVESIPQVWALYKEVQEYYDKGMRVPDDVTLLLCDDNWGNIRKLPKLSDKPRSGGYGIYYHYDYVGGPRNYKWLNTNQISRVWEQMHLAYEYGVDRIWIVNVGDIKPMEFPIEFFLDYAWNPEALPAEKLPEYTEIWAKEQFGAKYAEAIAHIITEYSRYNSRPKPELLEPGIYSVINYREAERVVTDYNELYRQAKEIYEVLSKDYQDAFYQLVMHPVEACSNLNELYVTAAKNHLYARQGRNITNDLAEKTRTLFQRDAEIADYYNNELANGKWNHMMDQTHIGYTYWQQPEKNSMPKVKKIRISGKSDMGVAIEGSEKWWPNEQGAVILPEFDCYNKQQYYIEIFNRGKKAFEYTVKTGKEWLLIDHSSGKIETEKRLWVSVDWAKIPIGKHMVPITITGPRKKQVVIDAIVNNPSIVPKDLENRFIETNGYVSIEAQHYSQVVNTAPVTWQCIPDLGRTESAMTAFPVTSPVQTPAGDSPRLEYGIYLFSEGEAAVHAYLCPTLNFHNNQGLRYGISFDNETPQIINIHRDKTFQDWEESVRNNITVAVSTHLIKEPGKHVLKFWSVDPGILLQRLVVETGKLKPSYLGPPESYFMAGESE